MNQFTNQNNLNQQLILDTATRKNYYNIAKWFNLASFIWSAIIFLAFLIMTITTASAIKELDSAVSAAQMRGLYIFVVIFTLINSIVSFCFWIYTKNLANSVGKAEETSHIAFGVFTFLFANWISGIFILIASSSFNRSQTLIRLSIPTTPLASTTEE